MKKILVGLIFSGAVMASAADRSDTQTTASQTTGSLQIVGSDAQLSIREQAYLFGSMFKERKKAATELEEFYKKLADEGLLDSPKKIFRYSHVTEVTSFNDKKGVKIDYSAEDGSSLFFTFFHLNDVEAEFLLNLLKSSESQ